MLRRHKQLDFTGSIHFITTVTRERGDWFAEKDVCRRALEIFEKYRIRHKLDCLGCVLMPDHLHALLHQDDRGTSVSDFMADFKRETSKHLPIRLDSSRTLWREGYDDVPVPGWYAAITKLQYMLDNPVRRGLVERPEDYPWSSAREHFGLGEGIVTVAGI